MSVELLNISAVVATWNRAAILQRALQSLAKQTSQPAEVVIVDASDGTETQTLCQRQVAGLSSKLRWLKAADFGAGGQRNQGVVAANEPTIWFFDDDVIFEQDCVSNLWRALQMEHRLGGVNAMIVNQQYHPPGPVSRLMFGLMNGRGEETFAGRVIGPAINLLPEDRDDLPEIVPVEWLNTTCTMYRREALPSPAFDPFFGGYSLMEDVALSLRVAERGWKLANARTARVFHDSKGGEHKSDARALSCMALTNRHFVMTQVLGRTAAADYAKLATWELFSLMSVAAHPRNWKGLPAMLSGKLTAAGRIIRGKRGA